MEHPAHVEIAAEVRILRLPQFDFIGLARERDEAKTADGRDGSVRANGMEKIGTRCSGHKASFQLSVDQERAINNLDANQGHTQGDLQAKLRLGAHRPRPVALCRPPFPAGECAAPARFRQGRDRKPGVR